MTSRQPRKAYQEQVKTNEVTNRLEFIEYVESKKTMKGHDIIYNLIKFNLMDWKVVTHVKGKNKLYHEKIGFFIDSPDEYYYF